ncbi:MAG: class I SAM-dependent methyltransferase [Deltaproteobacteria bacterium]|nr:class I SAM-dependent methyltransferase [Deltaproteobacteria bacterium]MBW2046342.1 class I SAM-dependent methyltransferase [Deltaproteobacteria bacterium]MBW2299576.1 class I SAM-dependent methyltransferase [Deltaproteobacteria bacterium]
MDFNNIAHKYDSWFLTPLGSYVDRHEKEITWRLAKPRAGEKVLDIGTGTANYLLELARMGLDCTGLEVSRKMISRALEKSESQGLNLKLVHAVSEAIPFRPNHFDLVISVTAFEFFSSPEKAISEMTTVCKPGGRIVIGILNKWSLWAIRRRIITWFKETIFTHCRFYSYREMKRLTGATYWGTAVFAPPWLPKFMLPVFEFLEPYLQKAAKPFGAYLVVCKKL